MTPGPGRLVAFEGGEGVGKSTQIRRLAGWLGERGVDVTTTFEPGATPLGQGIRGLLLDASGHVTSRAEALLYAADRAHHVETVLRPALGAGRLVLTDRYVDSSLAYQGAGRALDPADVRRLSDWASGGLVADLTVVLDLDPAVGLGRARRGGADRLEAESLAFHRAVRQAFLDLAAAEPGRYAVIDASVPLGAVTQRVREAVSALLGSGAPRLAP